MDAINELSGRVRGANTEYRFFQALQTPNLPSWFLKVRRATKDEDQNGVDAFVELDIGEVEVQIKSSIEGMRKHHNHYPKSSVLVIVLPRSMPLGHVRERILRFLYLRRGEIIRKKMRGNNGARQ